ATGEGAQDAAQLLKPALARGELRCIGATTLDEYRKHIEKDAALERRFQPVFVGEPTVESTIAILRGLKERYEVHHGVRISEDSSQMKARWENEKSVVKRLREIKEKLETERTNADLFQRQGNLEKVAEIRYGAIPALEKEQEKLQKELTKLQGDQPMMKQFV